MTHLIVTPSGGATLIAGMTQPIVTSGNTLGVGAWAQYSDGSSKYVEANWTSSDTGVIAFDGSSMQAVGRGTATVTAQAEGMSGTETFTVDPNMAGAWGGNLVVDQCSAGSGSMMELVCSADPARRGVLPVGTAAPVAFQIQKNGTDLVATTALGNSRGTLQGSDAGGNFFWLLGDLTASNTRITVVQWHAQVTKDAMDGQVGFEVRVDNVPSHAVVVAHLDQVKRR